MTIDRIDWHWDSVADDISDDEHWERAGAHIGYFLEWAYKKGFAPSNPETHDVDEYKKVINSEITGIQFLIENCDTKFWEEDLNEQGQKFVSFSYDMYLHNLETILGHKPYSAKYNQQDLENVFEYLVLHPASNYTSALHAPCHCVVKIPRRWHPIAVGISSSTGTNHAKRKYSYSSDGALDKVYADYLINNPLSEQIEKETHTLLKKLKGVLKK